MSSTQPAPSRLTFSLDAFAARLHSTTGQHSLPLICGGGFAAEMLWHSQVETRLLGTPAPKVRLAMRRACVFWPGVYVLTGAALWWAERRVGTAAAREIKGRENGAGKQW
ncbi:hypothetical protein Micbo1qcDRAFT_170841 [Microdochium bolleyi]|uniref:Uncharacterized protein n=1 Tax=Microdochium bolleyi TaxID=196109 RepID=A0A136JIY6_9PEZI|nr:hypothetical protein Micbo1qcDRAFT_170841 [Microdochium bolleyi]